MRKVNISYPVLSWGRSTIEVDDDATEDEILDALYDGTIKFRIDHMENHNPLRTIEEVGDYSRDIPSEIEVEEL